MNIILFILEKARFICQIRNWRFRFQTAINEVSGVWHFGLSDDMTNNILCRQIPILLGQNARPIDLGARVMMAYRMPNEMVSGVIV